MALLFYLKKVQFSFILAHQKREHTSVCSLFCRLRPSIAPFIVRLRRTMRVTPCAPPRLRWYFVLASPIAKRSRSNRRSLTRASTASLRLIICILRACPTGACSPGGECADIRQRRNSRPRAEQRPLASRWQAWVYSPKAKFP